MYSVRLLILFATAFCRCGHGTTPTAHESSAFHDSTLRGKTSPKTANQTTAWADGRKSVMDITIVGESAGLHNLLKLTDRIFSGSQPEGEDGFASLAKLGVKTIVSVDGARPDVETARRHGLRYVHVPIGYDGVPESTGHTLARLVQEVEGPIYIHCHHGKHRGPAAAAVACIASGATDNRSGLKILEVAGTSKDYPGLWRDVEAFMPPKPGTELPELYEIAEVRSLAAAMATMDRSYDLLELSRDAQWSVPPKHPDVIPAHEALQIKEGLREIARNLAQDHDDRFKFLLFDAEEQAADLERSLRIGDSAASTDHFQRLESSCKQCHAAYRN